MGANTDGRLLSVIKLVVPGESQGTESLWLDPQLSVVVAPPVMEPWE